MPPVMMRYRTTGLPLKVRKKVNPRRRYDLALSVPGAEMRLPSIPQVQFGWRLASGVLVVALGILLYHLWTSPLYRVGLAEVIGVKRVSIRDLNAVLNIMDEPLFAVDAGLLQQKILDNFPEISTVSIKVGWPNSVSVTVGERQPILAWKYDGRTVLVDANGFAFPMRSQTEAIPSKVIESQTTPPVVDQDPRIGDDGPTRFMSVELVSAILSISAQSPQNTALIYDPVHGLGWKDTRGWEVYFGDVSDMNIKLLVYKALVEHINREGISPVLISVEYVHNPFYRLEQ